MKGQEGRQDPRRGEGRQDPRRGKRGHNKRGGKTHEGARGATVRGATRVAVQRSKWRRKATRLLQEIKMHATVQPKMEHFKMEAKCLSKWTTAQTHLAAFQNGNANEMHQNAHPYEPYVDFD